MKSKGHGLRIRFEDNGVGFFAIKMLRICSNIAHWFNLEDVMERLDNILGLIDGINYDHIVNEREIERLHTWLDNNRHFSNDEGLSEAIKIVANVLDDGVVTEDEQEKLVDFSNKYQTSSASANSSLIVLNGIIEGIICDDMINDDEIRGLNEWLEANDFMQGVELYDLVYGNVQEILEDGIISEEEKENLLSQLGGVVIDSRSIVKINYLKKVVSNGNNVGLELISEIDDEDIIRKIHATAQAELNRCLMLGGMTASIDYEIIFLSLVLIALFNYDGNYYNYVEETYDSLYEKYHQAKISGLIRDVINHFRINGKEYSGRIINYVLMNAIVPVKFLPHFYEFMFDIYSRNFEYSLNSHVYDDLKNVFMALRSLLQDDNDELSIDVTKKTYKLIKTTKDVILSDESVDSIINLSSRILKIIDDTYWESETPDILNPYFKMGYDGWNDLRKRANMGRARAGVNATRRRWEPSFKLEGKKVILAPPIHNIRETDDYTIIHVNVYNGDTLVYEDTEPDIIEIVGGFRVEPGNIELYSPIDEVRYEVVVGDTVLYDSKDKLYRDFIIFNSKGDEIKNYRNYEGTACFCYSLDRGKQLQEYYSGQYYKLGLRSDITRETSFLLNDTPISFSERVKPGVIGEQIEHLYMRDGDLIIPVYRSVDGLVFETNKEIEVIGVCINGVNFKLTDFENSRENNGFEYIYYAHIDITEGGIYDIRIFYTDTNDSVVNGSFLVAVDHKYSSEVLQIDTEMYVLVVHSDIVGDISKDVLIKDLKDYSVPYRNMGMAYEYVLKIDLPLICIDDKDCQSFESSLWIDDINDNSKLEIRGFNCESVRILNSGGDVLEELILVDKHIYYECDLGVIRTYKDSNDYVILSFYGDDIDTTGVVCYMRCVMDKKATSVDLDFETAKIKFTPSYHGRGNVGMKIINNSGEVILVQREIESDIPLIISKLSQFQRYKLQLVEFKTGFTLNKERIMGEREVTVYSAQGLVGKRFEITLANYEKYKGDQVLYKELDLKRTHIKFISIEKDSVLKAALYYGYKGNQYTPIANINPVEVELVSDPFNDEIEAAITKDEDGLLLDISKHTIKQTLDDNRAPDICSYMINLRR